MYGNAAAALEVSQEEAVAQLLDGVGAWQGWRGLLRTRHMSRVRGNGVIEDGKSRETRHRSHVTCKHACKEQPVRFQHAMHLPRRYRLLVVNSGETIQKLL